MAKQILELDLEQIIQDEIKRALGSVMGDSWNRNIEDVIIKKLTELFISQYADQIMEKIDKQKMADLVAQRATLEIGKAFVHKGLNH